MAQDNKGEWNAEWEVEEEDVFIKIHGLTDPNELSRLSVENCKILGIDTEKPILKLNQYIFTGEFQDSFGTSVFFKEEEATEGKSLSYHTRTTKQLNAVRAILLPKEKEGTNETEAEDGTTDKETQQIEVMETVAADGK